ncbi:MAG: SOS response-associated peptidase [Telluria sp.]
MCGRLDQNHTALDYLAALRWERGPALVDTEIAPSFNACPGTYRPLLHIDGETLRVDDLYWGYRASWAVGKVPVAINARVEKLSNRYWGPLLRKGRALLAADGWYEWTGEKGRKQPWHVHRKDGQPLFIAALANFGPFREHRCEAGFVLVTSDALGGMVDVHDRRPVVLRPEDAALWLDPGLPPEQAEQLVRECALPSEAFSWYPVGKEVGRVGVEGAQLAAPIATPEALAQARQGDLCAPPADPAQDA